MYMLELARRRLARKPMYFSSMLFFVFLALTLATPFITLKMHYVICSSWLGIVLQRNEITVRVSVDQENTLVCNMPVTGGLVTTHHPTTNWSEIHPGLFKNPPHTSPVHTYLQLLSVSCAALIYCVRPPIAASAHDSFSA